jgi:hypothetical protein
MLKTIFMMLAVGSFLSFQAVSAQVVTGKTAPDFSLKDTKGAVHRLSDFKGRVVLLEWSNPDCPFVKKFYDGGAMQKWQADYAARGVVWFSVNSSASGKQGNYPPEELDSLLVAKGFRGAAALVDPAGKVGRLYGAQTTPHIFVIDPEGRLVYQGAIDDRSSADPADIASARNYAVEALELVLAGEEVKVPSSKSYGCSVKY